MGKVKGKHRLDKYYHLAKEHGYRSRAAWKLIQLDSKHSFLSTSRAVLDLCAAPGGWMQVAVKRIPVGSLVIGVDLVPIRPIRGAIAFESDITQSKCRSTIKKLMAENGCSAFDLILHDGSPNVGGAWAQEAVSQNALVIDSVKLATEFLAPKGSFVTKVFRSQDYSSVLYCLNQLFEKVEVDKPLASRSTSAEIYLLGFKYKAPAKIDPRLLDVRHLFQGSLEPKKVVDVLRGSKQKRHRDGYEDGETVLRKVCSAADFIWSETPLEILGSVSSVMFDDQNCDLIKHHDLTTDEIKMLCDDLRVLGKQDFKHILKWRMNIRKALSPKQKPDSSEKDVAKTPIDEDEKILGEMEELTCVMEQKKIRAKKLLARRRAKEKARTATGMQVDVMEDGYTDRELFSLSSIKGNKGLVAFDSAKHEEDSDSEGRTSDANEDATEENSQSDEDSEAERRRYDDQVEEILDEAYERFVAKRDGSTKQRKRAKKKYSEGDELSETNIDDEAMISADPVSDDEEENPLINFICKDEAPTQEQIKERWFNQDIFAGLADGEYIKKDEKPKQIKLTERPKHVDFEIVPAPSTDSSSSESDPEKRAEILAVAKKMLRKKTREEMLDDAYNRYTSNDVGLPSWFVEEEKRHMRPMKPVTKEEMAAMRAQFKEIDARPVKKVAEAKARRKRAAFRKLEKVRRKANNIADQTDISDRSKGKQIEELYKKAGSNKKVSREYVVAKKGVRVKGGKGKVIVDRRMKKDKRAKARVKGGKGRKRENFKGHGGKHKGRR